MNLLRRTRAIVFFVVALALAAALLVAERGTRGAIRAASGEAIAEPAARVLLHDVGDAFIAAALVALILASAAAALAGPLLARPLARLRAETLARARGSDAPLSVPPVHELRGVVSAVELLTVELRRQIDALGRERDEFALLVSSVSEGILQLGGDGRVVHANPAAQALLGLPGQVRGLPASALIRNAELRSVLERAAAGHDIGTCEVSMDERRLLVAARPLPGRSGGGAAVAFADLTEIRRLEGVRRDFVANVSHELKTPLTSIRGYVETLLTDDLPDEMQRQFLGIVQKNAERLHRIVDDLLDLSRLESGGWRPELQTVDVLRAAEDVCAGCRELVSRKGIDCRTEGTAASVIADPAGLRQVLSNLLDNAIRYTHEGGRIVVRVYGGAAAGAPAARNGRTADGEARGRAPDAAWVTLEVQDNGIGIPNDALGRVFERFYRVDPARSRAAGGTGLGLSIVKHLVERMGGDVVALSELGKGTTIRVRLPAAAP